MATRICDVAGSSAQAKTAKDKGYAKSFALTVVTITSTDPNSNQVTFKAKGATALFTASWTDPDVWTGCPTTIDSQPNTLPAPDSGQLLVGARIFNSKEFAPARQFTAGLKWPLEGGLGFLARSDDGSVTGYAPLVLQVTSLQITAAVPGQPHPVTWDLFASDCRNDVLDLSGVDTTLNFSNNSAPCAATELQVLSAIVYGKNPANGIVKDVDLLDPDYADPFQVVDLRKRPSVTVRLSQRGLGRFGAINPPGAADSAQTR
jgi:hypothetical protein